MSESGPTQPAVIVGRSKRGDCWSSMDDGREHIHQCELGEDHSDNMYDGYHQCECGEAW